MTLVVTPSPAVPRRAKIVVARVAALRAARAVKIDHIAGRLHRGGNLLGPGAEHARANSLAVAEVMRSAGAAMLIDAITLPSGIKIGAPMLRTCSSYSRRFVA